MSAPHCRAFSSYRNESNARSMIVTPMVRRRAASSHIGEWSNSSHMQPPGMLAVSSALHCGGHMLFRASNKFAKQDTVEASGRTEESASRRSTFWSS
jgi:hypothetical protein